MVDSGYIDVRFHFDITDEEGYTDYELAAVERVRTNIPQGDMLQIGETLGQSDHWHVDGVNATLDAMVDKYNERKKVSGYR